MTQLTELKEKFEALSKREQIILVATCIIGIGFGWNHFFFEPTYKKQQALNKEITSLKKQITDQQIIAIKLETGAQIDPNLDNKNKLAKLKGEHDRLKKLILHSDKNFAPPQQMSSALSDILSKNDKLNLTKLDTLPVTTLLKSKELQQSPIYEHGLEITFSGGYLDTFNYLKALEALPWHFIWESIDYRVNEFPMAETTIKVYTLSFKENWLGI